MCSTVRWTGTVLCLRSRSEKLWPVFPLVVALLTLVTFTGGKNCIQSPRFSSGLVVLRRVWVSRLCSAFNWFSVCFGLLLKFRFIRTANSCKFLFLPCHTVGLGVQVNMGYISVQLDTTWLNSFFLNSNSCLCFNCFGWLAWTIATIIQLCSFGLNWTFVTWFACLTYLVCLTCIAVLDINAVCCSPSCRPNPKR